MDTYQPNRIRVAIADTCAMTRAGLSHWLLEEPDMTVVAEADSDYTLLHSLQVHAPDVVLLDHSFCACKCMNLLQLLQENSTPCKVIVLAAPTVNIVQKVRSAGAAGYLFKDENRDAIVAFVRKVTSSGEEFRMSDRAQKLIQQAAVEYESARLTRMEKNVFALINYDNQTIAEKLYLAEGTVRNHVSSIYVRLNVKNRRQAVCLAQRFGVLHAAEDD
ncbi:MAG: response regulator transcription factor [Candidatus Kapaibacterium sp.]